MFLKHNEQILADKGSQLAHEHLRHLKCDNCLISVTEVSPRRGIFEGSSSFDELIDNLNCKKDLENVISFAPDANSHSISNTSSLPVVGNITERILLEQQSKRFLCHEEEHLFASKRAKQADQDMHLDPCAESQSRGSVLSSGLVIDDLKKSEAADHVDLSYKLTGCSQLIMDPSDQETLLKPPVRLHSVSSYYQNYSHAVGLCQVDELLSPMFGCFHRKPVAIGANHQADVPEWGSHKCKKIENLRTRAYALVPSTDCNLVNEVDDEKWIGSCVIPMPDSSSLLSGSSIVQCDTNCGCLDEGSVRCVRQHVNEARENLKKFLGQDNFDQLGLYDMGDDVAHTWTAHEEHLFQEVVLLNAVSVGKNFWNALPCVFPDRSTNELVSYYFNVFMLRKRAEQNRIDPLNIDSDNDEWQGSEGGESFAAEEEKEDSVVGSHADRDSDICKGVDHNYLELNEDAENGDDSYDYTIAGKKGHLNVVPEGGHNIEMPIFLPCSAHAHKSQIWVEQEVQDDS